MHYLRYKFGFIEFFASAISSLFSSIEYSSYLGHVLIRGTRHSAQTAIKIAQNLHKNTKQNYKLYVHVIAAGIRKSTNSFRRTIFPMDISFFINRIQRVMEIRAAILLLYLYSRSICITCSFSFCFSHFPLFFAFSIWTKKNE